MAYPPPWEHRLAERNLAAMWDNYRTLGYRRLIYPSTACVLPAQIDTLTAVIGNSPTIIGILLTCTHGTSRKRLRQREIGSTLEQHLASSIDMAERLQRAAPPCVHRICTDERSVGDIAAQIIALTGWQQQPPQTGGARE